LPGSGEAWTNLVARFKAECATRNDPCWLCRKPIDYRLTGRDRMAFSADHVRPTSLGGDVMRLSGLKPAHYGCNSRRGNTTRGEYPTSRQW